MSKRDHGLLAAAGLSVAAAAKLFGRSRQAIYSGMSAAAHEQEKSYFSAHDAMWILQYARQTDSDKLDQLNKFVEANYPGSETALLLQDQVGYEQVRRAVSSGEDVLIAFNGNLDELDPNATFAKILTNLLNSETRVRVLLPGEWVVGYMEQKLALRASDCEIRDDLKYLPSFVVIRDKHAIRAFFFQRFSPDECKPTVAAGLWEQFAPKNSVSAGDTLLATA